MTIVTYLCVMCFVTFCSWLSSSVNMNEFMTSLGEDPSGNGWAFSGPNGNYVHRRQYTQPTPGALASTARGPQTFGGGVRVMCCRFCFLFWYRKCFLD